VDSCTKWISPIEKGGSVNSSNLSLNKESEWLDDREREANGEKVKQ
jgi:hypothetical protein